MRREIELIKRLYKEVEEIAKIDYQRMSRAGKPEAIFAEHKTPDDLVKIVGEYLKKSDAVLITRASKEHVVAVKDSFKELDIQVNERGRCLIVRKVGHEIQKMGKVAILTAGTADIPVAEEASMTAEFLGLDVIKFYDVGIAGIHRIIEPIAKILEERVDSVIVIAGMEGALPSVIAGILDVPVIAVPTSIGYGVNLGGIATLFSMLQSCSSGIAVVNIDNGFGAAVFAYLISLVAKRRNE